MAFPPDIAAWLTSYDAFVNQSMKWSMYPCRTLGAASGALDDMYPFTRPSNYSGLLGGLAFYGAEHNLHKFVLTDYRCMTGFTPIISGRGAGTEWQDMDGYDWLSTDPDTFVLQSSVPYPTHQLDLSFSLFYPDKIVEWATDLWDYQSIALSDNYTAHLWTNQSYKLYAVTYSSSYEGTAPFLRIKYASDEAELDPSCIYGITKKIIPYNGAIKLQVGDDIALTSHITPNADHTITLSNKVYSAGIDGGFLRTINQIAPNNIGDIKIIGGDEDSCYYVTRNIQGVDPDAHAAIMEPGVIVINNSCSVCCECDDYVNIYDVVLRDMFDTTEEGIQLYNTSYEELSGVREQFNDMSLEMTQGRIAEYVSKEAGYLYNDGMWKFSEDYVFGGIPTYTFIIELDFSNFKDELKLLGTTTISAVPEYATLSKLYKVLLTHVDCDPIWQNIRVEDFTAYIQPLTILNITNKYIKFRVCFTKPEPVPEYDMFSVLATLGRYVDFTVKLSTCTTKFRVNLTAVEPPSRSSSSSASITSSSSSDGSSSTCGLTVSPCYRDSLNNQQYFDVTYNGYATAENPSRLSIYEGGSLYTSYEYKYNGDSVTVNYIPGTYWRFIITGACNYDQTINIECSD